MVSRHQSEVPGGKGHPRGRNSLHHLLSHVVYGEFADVRSPSWLVKLLATITNNQELKGAGELMSYFERVGEGNNPAQVNHILGAPTITLDMWLERRKARLGSAGT